MKNVGVSDRIIRAVLGVIFFFLGAFVFVGTLSVVAYILSATMLLTASVGFCPLYKLLGINTNRDNK